MYMSFIGIDNLDELLELSRQIKNVDINEFKGDDSILNPDIYGDEFNDYEIKFYSIFAVLLIEGKTDIQQLEDNFDKIVEVLDSEGITIPNNVSVSNILTFLSMIQQNL